MLTRLRTHFGTAGLIVAIVALVAAVGGTALAATGALTGKQKKEVTKIAKKYAGKPGAAGPQGPQGAPGAKGGTGPQGATGPQGPAGPQGAPGATGAGGPTGEAGMCSAAKPECSLATGGVLTGVWSANGDEGDSGYIPISFPVRVSPPPTVVMPIVGSAESEWGVVLEEGSTSLYGPYSSLSEIFSKPTEEEIIIAIEEEEAAYKVACPGNAAEPKATPGLLCIYERDVSQLGSFTGAAVPPMPSMSEAAHEFGINVPFNVQANNNDAWVRGSWALKK
jgi:hypothetical protein